MFSRPSTETKQNGQQSIPQIERVIKLIVISMLIGCAVAALYSLQASSWAQFASIVGVAFLIAGAFSFLGGLLGFLFGIPRTLQENRPTGIIQNENKENIAGNKQQEISYQLNTNLEQISDWLTKILVGVGLTQLSSLPDVLRQYADYTSAGLGNFPSSQVFSLALPLYVKFNRIIEKVVVF